MSSGRLRKNAKSGAGDDAAPTYYQLNRERILAKAKASYAFQKAQKEAKSRQYKKPVDSASDWMTPEQREVAREIDRQIERLRHQAHKEAGLPRKPLTAEQKAQQVERNRKWREKNPESAKATLAKYEQSQSRKEGKKKWQRENVKKCNAYRRKSRAKAKAKKEYTKKYYQANREKLLAYQRERRAMAKKAKEAEGQSGTKKQKRGRAGRLIAQEASWPQGRKGLIL